MAKIEDFSKSEEYIKIIDDSYQKGYHLHWITLIDSLIEQFLIVFYFLKIRAQERLDKEHIEFIKTKLGTYKLLRLLYLDGLIDKELYKDLDFFRSKRNLIIHQFILKNEKLTDLSLDDYRNIGKKSFEKLLIAIIRYQQIKNLTRGAMQEAFAKYKELL